MNSVPMNIKGTDYEIRFEQDDVMACEAELKMGYIFFFRVEDGIPTTLSFMLCRTLLHRGLKVKDKRGNLEYAFPQNGVGAKETGLLVQKFMQTGGQIGDIWHKCREAFELGWFAAPSENEPKESPEPEPTSKNLQGTGTIEQSPTP